MGMWFGLASVTMLFLGLTSAYLVREGLGAGWTQFPMPPLLLLNTAFLLASSLALEKSRRTLRVAPPADGRQSAVAVPGSFGKWTMVALALGLLFLAGQVIAWRQLAERGIYLSSNPSSSFFYTLTGVHGLHLLGGVIALGYLAALGGGLELATLRRRAEATAIYWHFMDGLWLYLFVLLFVWK